MINIKQETLVQELFQAIKMQFPEVELLGVTASPEDPNDVWLNVTAPADEDREIALIEFAGDKTTDILIDYGYDICVMPMHAVSAFGKLAGAKNVGQQLAYQPA